MLYQGGAGLEPGLAEGDLLPEPGGPEAQGGGEVQAAQAAAPTPHHHYRQDQQSVS